MTSLPYLAQAAYGVGLLGILALIGTALGSGILLKVAPPATARESSFGLEATLGLGLISYLVLGLGLIGQLRPASIALVLGLASASCWREWAPLARRLIAACRTAPGKWMTLSLWQKAIILLVTAIVFTVFLRSLAPPTGYDALMYHIEGPRLFLEAGRIFPSTSRWYINLPFTPEMLYALGIGLGSEIFPQLVELGWLLVFAAMVFSLAERFILRGSGWIAVGTVFTMPVLPIWASIANVDIAVAAMDLAAISFAFRWRADGETRWLTLCGLCTGLSLGAKYTSFGTVAVISLLIVWTSWRGRLRVAIRHLAVLYGVAAAVALPWYLKNYLWLGDPLFPFLGGGERLDPARMNAFRTYIETFRPEAEVGAWIRLPIDLYVHPERYSEIEPLMSSPSPLLLAALLAPAASGDGAAAMLLGMAALRLSLSELTSVEMRFLLPVFTLLTLAATRVLGPSPGARWLPSVLRRLVIVLAIALLTMSLLLQAGRLVQLRPTDVIMGAETPDEYLERSVPTYRAMSFAREQLPQGSRLLTTGDGRTYYCREACLNTDDQFLWSTLIASSQTVSAFVEGARARGATHLLVSQQDLAFFQSHIHSPEIQVAVQRLTTDLMPACGPPLYEDEFAAVYALDNCDGGT